MTAERLVTNELFLVFAYIVATVFTVSGLDDILYDLFYWVRWLFRLGKVRAWPKLTVAKLEAVEQQKVAVFIPAWQESDVILQMLRNACNTLRYRNYDLFVGTYQNDPDTQRGVDIAAKQFPQVHKVVVAADGPTTKADCLNRIYNAMRQHEESQGERYAIVVTHDAEDIIHPYSLLLDNYLIPRKDMVQLPVFPAPVPLRYFTYWTYADEFAENHTKDLLVRETSGGFVPCAGVGAAFSRRAFELVGLRGADEVFNERMLTEDYELGLRVRLRQLAAAFVSQRMRLPMPDPQHPERGPQERADWIATRSMFPRAFGRAVRQKTRWNLGIALQSWAMAGWQGNFAVRYNLAHDRKILLTNLVSFLGYVVFAYFVWYEIQRRFFNEERPVLIEEGTLLWRLVVVATILMAWRILQRFIAVCRVYGWWQAVLSIPRAIWTNLINFVATFRALGQAVRIVVTGRQPVWDKTAHEFPAQPELARRMFVAQALGREAFPAAGFPLRATSAERASLSDEIRRALASQGDEKQLVALRNIGRDNGAEFVADLAQSLKNGSPLVRSQICRTLSYLRLPETAGALGGALRDKDWTVRMNAARALTKLGEAGETALLVAVEGDDKYAKELALKTLEQYGVVQRNLKMLDIADDAQRTQARQFFQRLEKAGPSRLARRLLRVGGHADLAPKQKGERDDD